MGPLCQLRHLKLLRLRKLPRRQLQFSRKVPCRSPRLHLQARWQGRLVLASCSNLILRCLAGTADPAPKVKPKAKAGAKKKAADNPKAVFDVRKAKPSALAGAFPLVDRTATKELVGSVMLQKATWWNYGCPENQHVLEIPCSDHFTWIYRDDASARPAKWPRSPCSSTATKLPPRPWTTSMRRKPIWIRNGLQPDCINLAKHQFANLLVVVRSTLFWSRS